MEKCLVRSKLWVSECEMALLKTSMGTHQHSLVKLSHSTSIQGGLAIVKLLDHHLMLSRLDFSKNRKLGVTFGSRTD